MRTVQLLVAGLLAAPANAILVASATAGTISVTIPKLAVAEYHRPYVAGWIEPAAGGPTQTIFVWYQIRKGSEPGTKWLADLRTWWRKGGAQSGAACGRYKRRDADAGDLPDTAARRPEARTLQAVR